MQQADALSEPVDPPTKHHWYGWQILTADAISVALFAAGASGESAELMVLGVVSYALTPGVIHGGHGRAGAAFGSVGLRLGAPVLGAMAGLDDRNYDGAIAGFFLGMAGAVVIDVALLSHESVPEKKRSALMVQVAPVRGGATAGVFGSF
jgi:hypothetical protein